MKKYFSLLAIMLVCFLIAPAQSSTRSVQNGTVHSMKCYRCEGTGKIRCYTCRGIGTVLVHDYFYLNSRRVICNDCKGSKRNLICVDCYGTGQIDICHISNDGKVTGLFSGGGGQSTSKKSERQTNSSRSKKRKCPGCGGSGTGLVTKESVPRYVANENKRYCSVCDEVTYPHYHKKHTCRTCYGKGYLDY